MGYRRPGEGIWGGLGVFRGFRVFRGVRVEGLRSRVEGLGFIGLGQGILGHILGLILGLYTGYLRVILG